MGNLTALDVLDAVEVEPGRFVCTPHPVLLEGQTNVACDLVPGETLYSFLARHVDLSSQWEVSIGGVVVPVEMWLHVRPKDGQIIECRGAVNKQALALVAMVALTYFTFGIGAGAAGSLFIGSGAAIGGGYLAATAVYMAGSMLINKALAPKPPRMRNDSQDSVFSIQGQRNGPRPYEPVPLLFGTVQVTPDLASLPYTWYEGDDQYLGMALNFGIGVHRIDALQNGDTPLSSFEGATVYHNGFSGMPQQAIPVYSNADTIDGGTLEKNGTWIQRTTPVDTIRVQINLEYILGGQGTSLKNYPVSETIIVEHRAVGSTTWQPTITRVFRSSELKLARETLSRDLPRGQYDIRVRMTGQGNYSGKNTQKNDFDWTTMTAVQADDATYAGLARAGIRVKATGQLRALDQLKAIAYSHPIPVWTGTAWVTETTSNPGAQILAYARGINDENGRRVAGIGMLDEQIDIASLQAFMVHCAANGYTYDFYLKGARSHQEVVDSIALAGFGQVSWETGKLGVVWSAAGQPLSGVVNMATIKKGQFQVDYNLSNAADGVEFTYLDRSDWQTKTIRVPAPGIVTMLNPAQIQGEGVTSEAHAAQLARYHLAQSLYQHKDISFSTDLEHLSYKRLDVLTLQHDLTQWGYGGRIMAISRAGAVVTVELDEPVPAPASGPAYIGLRVPGERVYRVFPVAAFTGESDTLQLAAPWPVDAPFPGEHPDNPAHDTIWIYDFKATPGYRVRVVSKELESDTKGASVSVVPESPEFWTYVKTGEYQPPAGGSLLDTRPKASNARVTELQVVTGDVIHTDLSVTFDLKGDVSRTVIFAGLQGEELRPVDETITQTGRFRIGQAGTYTIVVRPYSLGGIAGDVATVTYSTIATDIPPPAFDWFTVTDEPGGLRRYAWGYTDDLGPPNLAGAEIRFIAGSVASPVWASMTPIGADGFHTAAFEAAIPASGQWTFAARARNTAGDLSPAFVLTKTLTGNLGEVIGGLEGGIAQSDQAAADALAAALAADAKAAQEIIDRQAADALLAAEQAVLRSQVGDILQADVHSTAKTYPKGDLVQSGSPAKLYRALQDVPAGIAITDSAYWEMIGNYASLGEAVSANVALSMATASDLEAVSQTVTRHEARMPTGTGKLSTEARVTNVESAAATATGAVSNRVGVVEARMPNGTDKLANEARVVTAENASVGRDDALSGRVGTVEARMPNGTDKLANEARVATAEQAAANAAGANATAILQVKADTVAPGPNLIPNPSGELGTTGWTAGGGTNFRTWNDSVNGRYFSAGRSGTGAITPTIQITPATPGTYSIGGDLQHSGPGESLLNVVFRNSAGGYISEASGTSVTAGQGWAPSRNEGFVAPAGTARIDVRVVGRNGAGTTYWRKLKLESGPRLTAYNTEGLTGQSAAITQSLTAGVGPGGAYAQATMMMDVNGRVSGTRQTNNGAESIFSVLADTSEFVSADGSFTITGGRVITRSGGYMDVSGKPFGLGGDLVEWYGPDVGNISNCSRSNAIFFKTNTGIFYAKGMIFAGTITAGGQTLALNATSYTTGTFGTNGGPIQINASFAHSKRQNAGQIGTTKNTIAKGAGTNGGSIELWRRIGGGGWEFVSGTTFGGTLNVVNYPDPEIAGYAQWSLGGSITYTDNVGGTAAREYEVRLTSLTMQDVTITGTAPIPAATEGRNIGVLTAEG